MKTKSLIDQLSREAEKMLDHMKPAKPAPAPKVEKKPRTRTKSVRAERVVPAIVQ